MHYHNHTHEAIIADGSEKIQLWTCIPSHSVIMPVETRRSGKKCLCRNFAYVVAALRRSSYHVGKAVRNTVFQPFQRSLMAAIFESHLATKNTTDQT